MLFVGGQSMAIDRTSNTKQGRKQVMPSCPFFWLPCKLYLSFHSKAISQGNGLKTRGKDIRFPARNVTGGGTRVV